MKVLVSRLMHEGQFCADIFVRAEEDREVPFLLSCEEEFREEIQNLPAGYPKGKEPTRGEPLYVARFFGENPQEAEERVQSFIERVRSLYKDWKIRLEKICCWCRPAEEISLDEEGAVS